MTSPIELIANLVVGTVESVSPGEVRVLLELDAPHSTALNTGTPTAFPRLNGYVLIPNESGATVAYVAWIGIERSPYPKRSGFKDFGLIDLPFPLRRMSVLPVGTLTCQRDRSSHETKYDLSRGVVAFPSVGDQVLIPTPEQVEAIVGASKSDRRIQIGLSPLAANAPIKVDPDKLFGRHLAVLGNTGSGKSCTVAGLIRWSLDAAQKHITDNGGGVPNARFIILDPNGEYATAFADKAANVRVFRVPPLKAGERQLDVPAWLWSGHEWTAMAHAQPGAQRPLLMQGLRELKSGQERTVSREARIRPFVQGLSVRVTALLQGGINEFSGAPRPRYACAELIQSIIENCTAFQDGVVTEASERLAAVSVVARGVIHRRENRGNDGRVFYRDFSVADLESIRDGLRAVLDHLPIDPGAEPIHEDTPNVFDVRSLAGHLEHIAVDQGGNVAAFIATLGLRIRGMLADRRLASVIASNPPPSFDEWLSDYVGSNGASNGPLAIVDLSFVPSEIVHIVVSVLARVIFEALQRYHHINAGKSLPTVLVMEEAHSFIRKGWNEDGPAMNPTQLCRETFERIAREGRKFGLGLVLSSQRPCELSPTVLAQCNTFLLHRIVNDSDQALVAKLVPDNVSGLLKELPSLPSRQAILLGWATPIPVLVEVDELPESQRPRSADPDFWDVWTLKSDREINWTALANNWGGTVPGEQPGGTVGGPVADGGV